MYRVEYAKGIVKDFKTLPKDVKQKALQIVEKVLASDPRMGKPLTGTYKGLWKYRIGDYRIVYSIFDDVLIVELVRVGHRRLIYD